MTTVERPEETQGCTILCTTVSGWSGAQAALLWATELLRFLPAHILAASQQMDAEHVACSEC